MEIKKNRTRNNISFDFEFRRYGEFHDKTVRWEMKISDINSLKRFVKLEGL